MYKLKTMTKWALSAGLAATLALVPLAGCASSDGSTPGPGLAQDKTDAAAQEDATSVPEEASVWVASTYKMSQLDADGVESEYSSTYELDEAGNLLRTTDTEDMEVDYTFDEDGWVTKVEIGDESWAYELEKDEQGRVIVERSDGLTTAYSYNDQGFVSERLDTSTSFVVDEDGNTVEGSEEDATTKTTYDENGFPLVRSRVTVDDKTEMTYEYEYGDDGLPKSATMTTRSYDADGNEYEDAASTTTASFEYDEHGNMVKEVLEDEYGTTTYEYGYVEVENPSMAVRILGHLKSI